MASAIKIKRPRVFVAYSKADRSMVSGIVEALRHAGTEVSWDQDDKQSQEWLTVLRRRIRASDHLVLALSSDSACNKHVIDEHAIAREHHVTVHIVQLGELVEQDLLPDWQKLQRSTPQEVPKLATLIRDQFAASAARRRKHQLSALLVIAVAIGMGLGLLVSLSSWSFPESYLSSRYQEVLATKEQPWMLALVAYYEVERGGTPDTPERIVRSRQFYHCMPIGTKPGDAVFQEILGTDQGEVDRWPGTGGETIASTHAHVERFSISTLSPDDLPTVLATGGDFRLPWQMNSRLIYNQVSLAANEGNCYITARRDTDYVMLIVTSRSIAISPCSLQAYRSENGSITASSLAQRKEATVLGNRTTTVYASWRNVKRDSEVGIIYSPCLFGHESRDSSSLILA
jgi:TIR domain